MTSSSSRRAVCINTARCGHAPVPELISSYDTLPARLSTFVTLDPLVGLRVYHAERSQASRLAFLRGVQCDHLWYSPRFTPLLSN
jgi:hypothetical protein